MMTSTDSTNDVDGAIPNPPQGVCPTCGRCPTCGHYHYAPPPYVPGISPFPIPDRFWC